MQTDKLWARHDFKNPDFAVQIAHRPDLEIQHTLMGDTERRLRSLGSFSTPSPRKTMRQNAIVIIDIKEESSPLAVDR
jgi:hypothetical protein